MGRLLGRLAGFSGSEAAGGDEVALEGEGRGVGGEEAPRAGVGGGGG